MQGIFSLASTNSQLITESKANFLIFHKGLITGSFVLVLLTTGLFTPTMQNSAGSSSVGFVFSLASD